MADIGDIILSGTNKLAIPLQNPADSMQKWQNLSNSAQEGDNLKQTGENLKLDNQRGQQDLAQKASVRHSQKMYGLMSLPDDQIGAAANKELEEEMAQGGVTQQQYDSFKRQLDAAGGDPGKIRQLLTVGIVGNMSGPEAVKHIVGENTRDDNGPNIIYGNQRGVLNPNNPGTWQPTAVLGKGNAPQIIHTGGSHVPTNDGGATGPGIPDQFSPAQLNADETRFVRNPETGEVEKVTKKLGQWVNGDDWVPGTPSAQPQQGGGQNSGVGPGGYQPPGTNTRPAQTGSPPAPQSTAPSTGQPSAGPSTPQSTAPQSPQSGNPPTTQTASTGTVPVQSIKPGEVDTQEKRLKENSEAYTTDKNAVPAKTLGVSSLNKALAALQAVATGHGTEGLAKMRAVAVSLGIGGGKLNVQDMNYADLEKNLIDYARQQATAGRSDAALDATMKSVGSSQVNNSAAQDIVRTNIGRDRMSIYIANTSPKPNEHIDYRNGIYNKLDPRGFAWDTYTEAQRQKMMSDAKGSQGEKSLEYRKLMYSINVANKAGLHNSNMMSGAPPEGPMLSPRPGASQQSSNPLN